MTKKIKHLVAIGAVSITTLAMAVPSSAQTIDKEIYCSKHNNSCIIEQTKKQIRCSIKDIIVSGNIFESIIVIPGNICGNGSVKPEEKPNETPEEKPSTPGDSNNTTKPEENPTEKPSEPGDSNVGNPDVKPDVKPEEKPDETPEVSTDFSAFQQQVLTIVNAERAKAGVSPLTLNSKLSNVATIKSQDMINNNYFDHNSPKYGSPFDMMNQFGISYSSAGENIAMGQTTPQEVMNSWMNSSGHRKNILNPSFTEIGVGIAKNSKGQLYWTQMFIGN